MTTTYTGKELTPELVTQIQQKSADLLNQASSFMEIGNIQDFNAAGTVITGLKKCEGDIANMIEAHFKPRIEKLDSLIKDTRSDRDQSKLMRVKPLVDARTNLMTMTAKWQREENARREAAANKLRARMTALALVQDRTPMNEVEVMEEEVFQAHLEKAREAFAEAQRKREEEAAKAANTPAAGFIPEPEPEPEPQIYIPAAPPVAMKGVSSKKNWKWQPAGTTSSGEITPEARTEALKTLVLAAAKEPHLLELLDFNDKALSALAKVAGPAGAKRPGIEFYNQPITAVRGA